MQPIDILILSNGPGELSTWVKPTVRALRQCFGQDVHQVRISLVLSPCPHANGQEVQLAQQYPEINRIQAADAFWPFLLWGKTVESWDWRSQGIVLFLGGDQFFTVLISRRLGYRTLIYAEWEARWLAWIDAVGAMNATVFSRVPQRYQHKIHLVGDLIAEVNTDPNRILEQQQLQAQLHIEEETSLVGLLPGSKASKLTQGVPLVLAIANHVQRQRPQTRFLIPVAPGLSLETLAQFADPAQNPWVQAFGNVSAKLVQPALKTDLPYLETASGLQIALWQQTPAYGVLQRCQLCLTTIGANTAELGALAVPMIVLLPTQQLDAMRAWDGLPGLLANLPGVGRYFAWAINWIAQRYVGLLAWPNIWAKKEIIPEIRGRIIPQDVAELVLQWLETPETLTKIRHDLQTVRGDTGAALKLALLAQQVMLGSDLSVAIATHDNDHQNPEVRQS